MYRVLAGKEDIGEFISRVVLAIEQNMYGEAVSALNTGLASVTAGTQFTYTGAFDMKELLRMAERVQVFNYNVRPVIVGSAVALMNVVPDSTLGYRGNYNVENGGAIQLFRNVYGYDVMKLDQAVGANNQLVLPENKIFVVSPTQDKLVKGAVSNSLTNSNQFYDNADLTQNFTMRKNYAFEYASAAKAGVYTITD